MSGAMKNAVDASNRREAVPPFVGRSNVPRGVPLDIKLAGAGLRQMPADREGVHWGRWPMIRRKRTEKIGPHLQRDLLSALLFP